MGNLFLLLAFNVIKEAILLISSSTLHYRVYEHEDSQQVSESRSQVGERLSGFYGQR